MALTVSLESSWQTFKDCVGLGWIWIGSVLDSLIKFLSELSASYKKVAETLDKEKDAEKKKLKVCVLPCDSDGG